MSNLNGTTENKLPMQKWFMSVPYSYDVMDWSLNSYASKLKFIMHFKLDPDMFKCKQVMLMIT